MKMRKVEKLIDKEWKVVEMKTLKKGDIFRLTSPGQTEFFYEGTVKNDACEVPDQGEEVWGVDVEDNGIYREEFKNEQNDNTNG